MENQEVVKTGFVQAGESFNPEDYFTAHRMENETFEMYKVRQQFSKLAMKQYLKQGSFMNAKGYIPVKRINPFRFESK